jgi:ABC-type transport system substrate-binding protein
LFADKQAVSTAGDQHRVNIKLNHGYLEPLSLMTFKVLPRVEALPENMRRPGGAAAGYDEDAFAKNPIGSGPFKFVPGKHSDSGRPYLSFVANVYYQSRLNKQNRPQLSEVRLFTYNNAVNEVNAPKHFLDLLLDLTPEEAAKIKDQGPATGFRLTVPDGTNDVPNRRVYFLAINHRKPELQSVEFRRALTMAINREKLLDDCFRGSLGSHVHKPVNGPFPAGSWANNPDPDLAHGPVNKKSADAFNPIGAAAKLKDLINKDPRFRAPALSLKYPGDDHFLEKAIPALAEQIEKTLPDVKITPEKVNPWSLRDQVEKTHDFDLAYYHYDFPDNTLSLWPLFGGEDNAFGYRDATMTGLLGESVKFCDFEEVQKRARSLHRLFGENVPLIPLWQLDPIHAIHKDVQTVPFDRHLVFTDIELWRLEGKRD